MTYTFVVRVFCLRSVFLHYLKYYLRYFLNPNLYVQKDMNINLKILINPLNYLCLYHFYGKFFFKKSYIKLLCRAATQCVTVSAKALSSILTCENELFSSLLWWENKAQLGVLSEFTPETMPQKLCEKCATFHTTRRVS